MIEGYRGRHSRTRFLREFIFTESFLPRVLETYDNV